MAKRKAAPLRLGLKRVALGLVGAALLAYPLDWAFWRVLLMTGHGMGAVNVNETTAATLKGNRFEVYSTQVTTVNCSHSLLPEAGAGPCWWLRRHPQIVTQY